MGRKTVSQKSRQVYLDERGKFRPKNPGKPHGAVSYRTRFLMSVLNCWGEAQERLLRRMLAKPDTRFLKAMDRVIQVYGIGMKAHDESATEMPPLIIQIEGESAPIHVAAQKDDDAPSLSPAL